MWVGPEASNVNVISSTLIEAVTAPGEGTVPVVVLNPDGQLHRVDDAFTYVPASLIADVVPVWITVSEMAGTPMARHALVEFENGMQILLSPGMKWEKVREQ